MTENTLANTQSKNIKIKWRKSIRFKYFIMLAIYLIVAISILTWNNSSILLDYLRTQNEKELISISERTSSSLQNILDLWATIANLTMHQEQALSKERKGKAINALLESNSEIISAYMVKNDNNILTLTYQKDSKYLLIENTINTTFIKNSILKELEKYKLKKNLDQFIFSIKNSERKNAELLAVLVTKYLINNEFFWFVIVNKTERISALLGSGSRNHASILTDTKEEIFSSRLFRKLTNEFNWDKIYTNISLNNMELKKIKKNNSEFFLIKNPLEKYSIYMIIDKNANADDGLLVWRVIKTALFATSLLSLSLSIVYFVVGLVTNKIFTVINATLNIASGNFNINLPKTIVKAEDEISLLAKAIHYMSKQIQHLLVIRATSAKQEAELLTARAVERALFPPENKSYQTANIFAFHESASECAGDWWDYFEISNSKLLILLGDATGHGAGAALVATMCATYFRTQMKNIQKYNYSCNLSDLFKQLNEILLEQGKGKSTISLIGMIIDSSEQILTFVNAGIQFPFVIPKNIDDARITKSATKKGGRAISIICSGNVLGSDDNVEFKEVKHKYQKNDKVFLFSDGLIEETHNGEPVFSKKELKNFTSDLAELNGSISLDKLKDLSVKIWNHKAPSDDVTAVIVEME